MALKRIQKELLDNKNNPHPSIFWEPVDESDYFNWSATILGPENSPYANGLFKLNIQFTSDYPFKPPRI